MPQRTQRAQSGPRRLFFHTQIILLCAKLKTSSSIVLRTNVCFYVEAPFITTSPCVIPVQTGIQSKKRFLADENESWFTGFLLSQE